MRRLLSFLLVLGLATSCATTSQHVDVGPFQSYPQPLMVAEAALEEAQASDRLVLLVLGGNWCHDSKALVDVLHAAPLSTLMEARYVTRLISVGYLDEAEEVAARYSAEGHYLHTPTVLIIDPVSGETVNQDNHIQFRDASKLGSEEIHAYFEGFADGEGWALAELPRNTDDVYSARLAEIDETFRKPNIARLKAAYAYIGPKLEVRSDDFRAAWKPVATFRYAFGEDLMRLKAEVRAEQAAGTTNFSPFPAYPAFDWEEGA